MATRSFLQLPCALLTSESGNLDKVALYVEECRRMNIEVLPPDINHSVTHFNVEGKSIRFGLSAIKNMGEAATRALVSERHENGPYKDIFDLCNRLDSRMANRRLLESLNKAGAFSSTGWNRRQVEAVIDDALAVGQSAQRDRASGQTSLFEMADIVEEVHSGGAGQKPDLPEWPEHDLLQYEKEVLGLYASSHPLARHAETIRRFSTLRLAEVSELQDGQEVSLGGLIGNVKTHITGQGKKMAFITVETLEGPCELTLFSEVYEQSIELLIPDTVVLASARMSRRNGEPGFLANNFWTLDQAVAHLTRAVHVRLDMATVTNDQVDQLATILGAEQGACDVFLHCQSAAGEELILHATSACCVNASSELRNQVEALLGPDTVWFSAGMGYPTHQPPKFTAPEQPRWKKKKTAV